MRELERQRPPPPLRINLPGQFDSYARTQSSSMPAMPSLSSGYSFQSIRSVSPEGWGQPSAPIGNPYAKTVKEAFPQLSLDPRSPDYIQQLKTVISQDIRAANGREANEEDFNYWIPKFLGECDSCLVTGGQMSANDYWHNRLLGMGAGGADAAIAGPYAGGDASGPSYAGTSAFGSDWLAWLSEEELKLLLEYLQKMNIGPPELRALLANYVAGAEGRAGPSANYQAS